MTICREQESPGDVRLRETGSKVKLPQLTCMFNPYFAFASCMNAHMAVLLGSGCSQSFLGVCSKSMFGEIVGGSCDCYFFPFLFFFFSASEKWTRGLHRYSVRRRENRKKRHGPSDRQLAKDVLVVSLVGCRCRLSQGRDRDSPFHLLLHNRQLPPRPDSR